MSDYGVRRNPDPKSTATNEKIYNLDDAACCPTCYKPPRLTYESPVWPYPARPFDYILRCPLGHAPVSLGHTLSGAVELWNAFIEYHMIEKNQLRVAVANPENHSVISLCPNCQTHTASKLTMLSHRILEQCNGCKFMKSVKEID